MRRDHIQCHDFYEGAERQLDCSTSCAQGPKAKAPPPFHLPPLPQPHKEITTLYFLLPPIVHIRVQSRLVHTYHHNCWWKFFSGFHVYKETTHLHVGKLLQTCTICLTTLPYSKSVQPISISKEMWSLEVIKGWLHLTNENAIGLGGKQNNEMGISPLSSPT